MRTYKAQAPYNRTITKVGRSKSIRYTMQGEPYFIWGGRRQHLGDVMRLTTPMMYEDEDGKLGVIGGVIGISNTMSVLVEVDEYGESVQLWRELEEV